MFMISGAGPERASCRTVPGVSKALGEEAVQAEIIGHLGMEGETEVTSLADGHRLLVMNGQNFDAATAVLDDGGTDEDGTEGGAAEAG
jgi:hypothetical protein